MSPAEKREDSLLDHPTVKLTTSTLSNRCPISILGSTLKIQMDNSGISIHGRMAPMGNTVTKTSRKRDLEGTKTTWGQQKKNVKK